MVNTFSSYPSIIIIIVILLFLEPKGEEKLSYFKHHKNRFSLFFILLLVSAAATLLFTKGTRSPVVRESSAEIITVLTDENLSSGEAPLPELAALGILSHF